MRLHDRRRKRRWFDGQGLEIIIIIIIIIIIKNEKIRVTLSENAAGALYIVNMIEV